MFCTNCGKEIPDDSVFCDFCGSRVQTEEEREKTVLVREEPGSGEGEAGQMKEVYCTNCGKPVSEGDRFCIYCGEVIGEDVTPEEIKVMKKGRGKVHLPHINKKIAVAAAAVVVVAGAGLGLGGGGDF